MTNLLTPQEVLQALIDGKKVEYRHPHLDWAILKPTRFKLSKLFDSGHQFRLAQEMIIIGDVSFPKPVSEPLTDGADYWIANPAYLHHSLVHPFTWCGDNIQRVYLSRGLIHLSRENAIAHAKALIKLSGGNCE